MEEKLISKSMLKELAVEISKQIKPPALIVNIRGVEEMLGFGTNSSAVRKLVKSPGFPPPFTLGDSTTHYWRRSDIAAWINQQVESQSKISARLNRVA